MADPVINWTKTFDIYHNADLLFVFISSHSMGIPFYGVILHYDRSKNLANGDLQMETVQFYDYSEKAVYDACINWIETNKQGEYTIIEKPIFIP